MKDIASADGRGDADPMHKTMCCCTEQDKGLDSQLLRLIRF